MLFRLSFGFDQFFSPSLFSVINFSFRQADASPNFRRNLRSYFDKNSVIQTKNAFLRSRSKAIDKIPTLRHAAFGRKNQQH